LPLHCAPVDQTEARELSRLLFSAREAVEMFADVAEASAGRTDTHLRQLVADLDAYRAERGWSADGFGGETGT
jgi:hypothetical protein